VVGERQPGNETLLETGGGYVRYPALLELAVCLAGEVGAVEVDTAVGDRPKSGAGLKEQALPASLHAGQADGLARLHLEVETFEP